MSMASEKRKIELTVISATDLKKVKKLGRSQHCYVVAYIYPGQKKATEVDNYGGVNPNWNATLTLTCEESLLHQPNADATLINVEILCHSHLSGNKVVGTVSIPLRDVLREGKLMPFLVLTSSHQPEGILNVSVKLGEKLPLGEYEDLSAPSPASYSSTS